MLEASSHRYKMFSPLVGISVCRAVMKFEENRIIHEIKAKSRHKMLKMQCEYHIAYMSVSMMGW